MPILTAKSSSVARSDGGRGGLAPYWHVEYAKYPLFITFETNFCSKGKNSPPIVIGNKTMTVLLLYLKRIRSQNSILARAKTFFFLCGLHLISGKNRSNSKCKLFQFGFTPPRQSPPLQIPGYEPG